MLAITCPGQGSQTPGFLAPWLEVPVFLDRLGWFGAVSGTDLIEHGTASGEETIRDTAVAQPLIVAAGLVGVLSLFDGPSDLIRKVGAVAGHSVGELTAAAAAGVLNPEQAMVLARERGRSMAKASAATPTGMSAVIGGHLADVIAAIESTDLTVATINGARQVVAAGTLQKMEALRHKLPPDALLVALSVAGAFHTYYMAPAENHLKSLVGGIATGGTQVPVISNSDGAAIDHGADLICRIVQQVSRPVRWDLCQRKLVELGVTGIIEMPPAGILTGFAKRELKGIETLALKTPDDLPKARRMVREHGVSAPMAPPTPC